MLQAMLSRETVYQEMVRCSMTSNEMVGRRMTEQEMVICRKMSVPLLQRHIMSHCHLARI